MLENDSPMVVDFAKLSQLIQAHFEGRKDSLDLMLNGSIQVAIAAAKRHKKGASVTLKLAFVPGSGNEMDIAADISITVPKPKPAPIMLFADKDGRMLTDDPDQVSVPGTKRFRRVEGGDPADKGDGK